jgi:hypothetical protein
MSVIVNPHTPPHTLTVPLADVMAGVAKTYTLTPGAANMHTHMLAVTAADFATLKSAGTIATLVSDMGMVPGGASAGHTHAVTLTCGA